jgi:hypothetical protein
VPEPILCLSRLSADVVLCGLLRQIILPAKPADGLDKVEIYLLDALNRSSSL